MSWLHKTGVADTLIMLVYLTTSQPHIACLCILNQRRRCLVCLQSGIQKSEKFYLPSSISCSVFYACCIIMCRKELLEYVPEADQEHGTRLRLIQATHIDCVRCCFIFLLRECGTHCEHAFVFLLDSASPLRFRVPQGCSHAQRLGIFNTPITPHSSREIIPLSHHCHKTPHLLP